MTLTDQQFEKIDANLDGIATALESIDKSLKSIVEYMKARGIGNGS